MADLEEVIEEFAISLFAQQEVGTRFKVSEKRLDRMVDDLRAGGTPA